MNRFIALLVLLSVTSVAQAESCPLGTYCVPVVDCEAEGLSDSECAALNADRDRGAVVDAGELEVPEENLDEYALGENTEQLQPQQTLRLWIQDETNFYPSEADRTELVTRDVEDINTIKLDDVMSPIEFRVGQSDIPERYLTTLRQVLRELGDRENLHLHFVGHTDNDPLGPRSTAKYGDNVGLSRARAAAAAEYFSWALNLSPESVTFDGVGAAEPLAPNTSPANKKKNRRVEIQVWYDDIKRSQVTEKVVKPKPELNRLRVCRQHTVCQLKYKTTDKKKVRLKNIIPPLQYGAGRTEIPELYVKRLRDVWSDVKNQPNAQLRFVGHSDSNKVSGSEARVYGNNTALSKARAQRIALAAQEALGLTPAQLSVDGTGDQEPLASNDTEAGRALNRRVELEVWYDEPLPALPEEPQACPESRTAETINVGYQSSDGPLPPVRFKDGDPQLTDAYIQRLKTLLETELKDKANLKIHFIGYSNNERMTRRAAMVYGDDIGLSIDRARRVMEQVKDSLDLRFSQVRVEGRGFVDPLSLQGIAQTGEDTARVEIEITYDDLAQLEQDPNLDITRITQVSEPVNPFALNLMRITVDGTPINDVDRHSADIQRCTDVALDRADIQLKYDALMAQRQLSVAAWPNNISIRDLPETDVLENEVVFRVFNNYPSYIDKAEVRLFREGASLSDTPYALLPVEDSETSFQISDYWQQDQSVERLKYVVRVYDKEGRFDETEAQTLWVSQVYKPVPEQRQTSRDEVWLSAYGKNYLAQSNIPVDGGTVTVRGESVPDQHTVWVAGNPVPLNREGRFIAQQILPPEAHSVEVAVLDAGGNGNLYLRDLNFQGKDWFYVGLADLTLAIDDTSGPASLVTGDEDHYNSDALFEGRLAFYTKGQTEKGWNVTASADTREEPLENLFTNFAEKTPDALFRRIDPDYYQPTFGDDSTTVEDAPTSGKFYVKAEKNNNFGMWGNFEAEYLDSDLTRVDRGLYGANGHYQSNKVTAYGEQTLSADSFIAEPGTLASREEYRGTGGSLYFLKHQDITQGSERVTVEIRDQDSGIVLQSNSLLAAQDYDIDYIQGRVILSTPLPSTADDSTLVQAGDLSGNPVYLVVRYEYVPGFESLDDVAIGGQVDYWANDKVKLGATLASMDQDGEKQSLSGVDLTLRKTPGNYLKFEVANSEGAGVDTLTSEDGGYEFNDPTAIDENTTASAYRIEAAGQLSNLVSGLRGRTTAYIQQRDAGFSAPGQQTDKDTQQLGGTVTAPILDKTQLYVKYDQREQELGLDTKALNTDVRYKLTEQWTLTGGMRYDQREDNSLAVPNTQTQGDRTDVAFEAAYNSFDDWTAYTFAQVTVENTDTREENNRVGAGGTYQINDKWNADGELSVGDTGTGIKAGATYLYSEQTRVYSGYTLDNERGDDGLRRDRGDLVTGARTRYSDNLSVYGEEHYAHGDQPSGFTHAVGADYGITDAWTLGASVEAGNLQQPETGAITERVAVGATGSYSKEKTRYSGAMEYRTDTNDDSERVTLLLKNAFKYQVSNDWRFVGKFNYSTSESSLGEFYDGDFTELVTGYAYRPTNNDQLNALVKYTYFYNLPSVDQETVTGTAAEFIQRSQIFSGDVTYDLNARYTVGGKLAYRLGEVATDREDPEFFQSNALLTVLRGDWHVVRQWDVTVEGRVLDLPDAEDTKSGFLTAVYYHWNPNIKVGVGYNFTDFSDDLTDLSFTSQGLFINAVGKI